MDNSPLFCSTRRQNYHNTTFSTLKMEAIDSSEKTTHTSQTFEISPPHELQTS